MVGIAGSARRCDLLTARAQSFCSDGGLDPLGISRIPARTLDAGGIHPDVATAVQLFIPRLTCGDGLSRGECYYDIRSALLAWPALVRACRQLDGREEETGRGIALALYENLFNVVAAMTFSYWEHCCDEPARVVECGSLLAFLESVLPKLARLHLRTALGPEVLGAPRSIDWELLGSVGSGFPRGWRLRTLREFDNKARVLNEVLYLDREVRRFWPFQVVLFPLYGALTLAAYFTAVERFHDGASDDPPSAVLIRLGLYERGPISHTTPDGRVNADHLLPRPWQDDARRALHGRRVLVADDNAATGHTLRACRDFVLECGGVPLTRSAETSWELLQRHPQDQPPFDGVDLPGLRTNMSYAVHRSLVDLLLRRQWDRYAESAAKLGRTDFSATLLRNYQTARNGSGLGPRQRSSVEREWAHARRNWQEPAYLSVPGPADLRVLPLPRDGFPAGVRPWALAGPALGAEAGNGRTRRAPSVVGLDSFVVAAGSLSTVGVRLPGPGRLLLRLGGWSKEQVISVEEVRRGRLDIQVPAPLSPGGHELVLQLASPSSEVEERHYPVHVVVQSTLCGAVRFYGGESTATALRQLGAEVKAVKSWGAHGAGAPLVVGEGALDQAAAPLLRSALAAGGTVLVLAQQPHAAEWLPVPATLEPIPVGHSLVRFTTAHHALASLPRHRVLSFEDRSVTPSSMFTRLCQGPWSAEVAVGILAPDSFVRGTVVGAQEVGRGHLIVCQLRLVDGVAAAHPGACALLADVVRWAAAPRPDLAREDEILSDGRSMSFYSFPGGRV